MDIGFIIRSKRCELGLSQFELAGKLGTSSAYVSNLELGKLDPRWSTLERIFKELHLYVLIPPYINFNN